MVLLFGSLIIRPYRIILFAKNEDTRDSIYAIDMEQNYFETESYGTL